MTSVIRGRGEILFSMTKAAQEFINETGSDPRKDFGAFARGEHTEESLLVLCLNRADDDRVQGCRDYVRAVVNGEVLAGEPLPGVPIS